jgi:broad specificity phosphatase PhoE
MTAIVYLVRHATPDWSRTDIRYDIPPGPPLTPQGESEAAKLGVFLHSTGAARIFASPLERALRTAQIAAAAAAIPLTVEEGIAEWRTGEPEPDVLARMLRVLDAVAAHSDHAGPTVLVSHGGPIRLVLQHAGVLPDELTFFRRQFDRDNPLPPAGAWRLARPHAAADGWSALLEFTPESHRPYIVQAVLV